MYLRLCPACKVEFKSEFAEEFMCPECQEKDFNSQFADGEE